MKIKSAIYFRKLLTFRLNSLKKLCKETKIKSLGFIEIEKILE